MEKMIALIMSILMTLVPVIKVDNTMTEIDDSTKDKVISDYLNSIEKLNELKQNSQEQNNEVEQDTEATNQEEFEIEQIKESKIKLSIVGDCLLASYKGNIKQGNFASKALEHDWGYFFDGVDEIFKSDDFSIVNLECVLSDNKLSPATKNSNPAYWYIGPTENTNILTTASVEICNLSNNHTGDYGTKGAQDTIDAVVNAGMLYGNNDHTCYFEKDGFKIALICNGLWYEGQEQQIIKRIKDAETQSDFQIVYYHGGKERVNKPEDWRIRASRKLVDGGADLVIGNHPHVIQPMEVYNGVTIVYSMGNFVFGDESRPQNRTIVFTSEITFSTENNQVINVENNVIPCYIYTGDRNQWQPTIIPDGEDKDKVMDFMNWKVNKPL